VSKFVKTACGTALTEETVSTIYENKVIYFCEKECLKEFNESPHKFLESDHFLINFELLENSIQ
jgi:YHS domain-containing protein